MRQKLQSLEDAKFCKALENMRYRFRNVSIITAWNSQKDRINELGSAQFAKETNQPLVDFYSTDKWVVYEDIPEKVTGHKQRKRVKATENSTKITQADQHKLWDLPH